MWPEVLNRLREIKRTPWSLISQESSVVDLADGVLTLAFKQPTLRDTFIRRDDFQSNLRQAITDVLGIDVRIEAIVDPSVDPAAARQGQNAPPPPAATGSDSSSGSAGDGSASPATRTSAAAANARAEIRATATSNGTSQAQPSDSSSATPPQVDPDEDVDPSDRDLDDSGLSERELLERTLGATVIEEIDHN
jgi:DNA polymerase-3 subunit gamma/tau